LSQLIAYDALVTVRTDPERDEDQGEADDPRTHEEAKMDEYDSALGEAMEDLRAAGAPLCAPPPARADIPGALGALIAHIRAQDGPMLGGAWSMGEAHAAACAAAFGPTPGGFDALFGVVAAGPFITIEAERIRARRSADAVVALGAPAIDERLRRVLTDTFTPPTVFGALTMLIGLHPFWGIKASSALALSPDAHEQAYVRAVGAGLRVTTGAIMGALAALDPDVVYPVDALARYTEAAILAGRARVGEVLLGYPEPPIPVFFGPGPAGPPGLAPSPASRGFVGVDLLPCYLVPAGIAHRPTPDTFGVFAPL
jgi:hypothetical protein